MIGNRVMNIPNEPSSLNDAVSAKYVNQSGVDIKHECVLRNGPQPMTNHLNMGSYSINNVLDPANLQDVATKNYVYRLA